MTAHIESWAIVPLVRDPYQAPESAGFGITGRVTGHPDFKDGTQITTSRVAALAIEEDRELHVITKSGSVYRLGQPHPDYEAAYPNSRKRLIDGWLRQQAAG